MKFTNICDVLFIDDCSNYDHYEKLKELLENKCKIIRNEKNLGPWLTRMLGIDLVQTKYFMFADADDELLPERVLFFLQKEGFKNKSDIISFGFEKYYMDGKKKEINYQSNLIIDEKKINRFFNKSELTKTLYSRFYKTSSIRPLFKEISSEVGKFRVAEDWYAITYLLSKNLSWEFREEIVYKHIKRCDSTTVSNYSVNEVLETNNNAIFSLINKLANSKVENRRICSHILEILWKTKSTHYHSGLVYSLKNLVKINISIVLYPLFWFLLIKSFYVLINRLISNNFQ